MRESIENPWEFEQPPYDERSSCFVNAGTNQGVGKRQPVGSVGSPKKSEACPRTDSFKTLSLYPSYERLNVEE